jgi:hypothetical protein
MTTFRTSPSDTGGQGLGGTSPRDHTIDDRLREFEQALMAFDAGDADSVARFEGARLRLALSLIRHDRPEYEPEHDGGALLRRTLEDVFLTWGLLP